MKSEKLKAVAVYLIVMSAFYAFFEIAEDVLAGVDFNLVSVLRQVLVFDLCIAVFSLSLEYKKLFMIVSVVCVCLVAYTFIASLLATEVDKIAYQLNAIVFTVVTVVYIVSVKALRLCDTSIIDDTLKSLSKLMRK